MLKVGLTGGIASGKSSVARMFVQRGARLIDADSIAREAVSPGAEGLRAVQEAFGPDMLTAAGELDRVKLGALVFSDVEKRKRLDAVLHPLIIKSLFRGLEALAAQGFRGVAVADVPLLFECGLECRFDKTVLVYADPAAQRQRLIRRNGLTADEALQRIGSQMPIDEKRRRADYVIDNTGSFKALEAQAEALWRILLGLAEKN